MLAFACLWYDWKDPANGLWLQTFTIITTEANERRRDRASARRLAAALPSQ